jgi:stage III sporulation protein AE
MFKSTQVSEISFFMLYMMLITITLTNFRILAEAVTANLGRLLEFMKLLGPIYFLAVGISTGSSTSITFYQVVLLLIFLVEMLILNFLVPLAQLYLIMRILGEMSPELPLTKFSELLETIISWSLKTLMAGIIGLNLIQGLISPAIDTVKRSFLTKTGEALPIVGDVIGGTTEIVLGTAVLIKNGIGVAGMVLCFVICLAPLLQMAITTLLYQLVAALIQPISDKRMVNCVSSMADSSKLLLKILSTTMVLFLLTIVVVSSTTGG